MILRWAREATLASLPQLRKDSTSNKQGVIARRRLKHCAVNVGGAGRLLQPAQKIAADAQTSASPASYQRQRRGDTAPSAGAALPPLQCLRCPRRTGRCLRRAPTATVGHRYFCPSRSQDNTLRCGAQAARRASGSSLAEKRKQICDGENDEKAPSAKALSHQLHANFDAQRIELTRRSSIPLVRALSRRIARHFVIATP